jgi:carboxymethylenebutenolidase
MTIQSAVVQFKVNEATGTGYLARPEKGGPGILVLHAWWGLNPFFKQLCERLAEEGFTAFAPDLNNGDIADTIEVAKELMEKRDDQAQGNTVMAAKAFLLSHPARLGNEIGVIGFSMGAAWAVATCAFSPESLAAVVLFYGSYTVDFAKAKAKVLGHFAEVDEWEPAEGVSMMEKAMKTAGLDVTVYTYPGTSHWFMEEDRPEYNPSGAKLAWDRSLDFLKTFVK